MNRLQQAKAGRSRYGVVNDLAAKLGTAADRGAAAVEVEQAPAA